MIPVNLKKADAQTLQIEWEDGEISFYPLIFLRRNCPCASCREASRQRATPANPFRILQPQEVVSSDLDLREAEVVGRYALVFTWSDGHREGIYPFDYLRELAQDEVCRKARQEHLRQTPPAG